MATVYVLWDRNNKKLIGGATPQIFMTSAEATTFGTRATKYAPNLPKGATSPVFDAVAVTA